MAIMNYDSMLEMFTKEYLKAYTFDEVLKGLYVYTKMGFDKREAEICAYVDSRITAAISAVLRVIEANNASL